MRRPNRKFLIKAFNIALSFIIFVSTLTIPAIPAKAADYSNRPIFTNIRAVPYFGVGLDGVEHNGVMLTWDNVGGKHSWCEVIVSDRDLGYYFSGTSYDPDNQTHVSIFNDLYFRQPKSNRSSLCFNDPYTTQAFISTQSELYIENTAHGSSAVGSMQPDEKVGTFQNKQGTTYFFYILAYQDQKNSGITGGKWFIMGHVQYTPPGSLGIIPNGLHNTLKLSFVNHGTTQATEKLVGTIQRFDSERLLASWAPTVSYLVYAKPDGTYRAQRSYMEYSYGINGYPLNSSGVEVTTADASNPCAVINKTQSDWEVVHYDSFCTMQDTAISTTAPNGDDSYYRYVFISHDMTAATYPNVGTYVDVGPQVSYTTVTPTGTTAGTTGSITFNLNKVPIVQGKNNGKNFYYWAEDTQAGANNSFASHYRWTVVHVSSTDVNTCDHSFSTDENGYVNTGVHSGAGECGTTYHPYSLISTTAVFGGSDHASPGSGVRVPGTDILTGTPLTNNNGSLFFNGNYSSITFHFASMDKNSALYRKRSLITYDGTTTNEDDGETYDRKYILDNLLVPGKTYVFSFVSDYYFNAGEVHPQTGETLTQPLNFFGTTRVTYTVPITYIGGVSGYNETCSNWTGVVNYPIDVDITWGDMEFYFDKPKWDGDTHTYPAGEWKPVSENSNLITIKNNNQNASITASLSYSQANSDIGQIINGSFQYQGGDNPYVTSVNVAPGGWAKSVRLHLLKVNGQEPTRDINGETAGGITITINEMYSVLTSTHPNRNQAITSGSPY